MGCPAGTVALLGLAACSFHVPATSDQPPDAPVVFDDAGNQFGWFKRDTAADFAEDGATFAEIAVETRPTSDVLTPGAYYQGGVIARGSATCPFADQAAVDFAILDALTPSGVAPVEAPTVDVSSLPAGVQVTADQSWAYWIEGELKLTAGANALGLRGDDFGALEIAPPSTRSFARVYTGSFGMGVVTADYDAPADGWYPFRAMICQTNGGGASLTFSLNSAKISRDQLRARVESLRGPIVTGWQGSQFSRASASTLLPGPLLADPLNTPPPGVTDHNSFSARWYGQVRIDVAGSYSIRADTDDGNRLYVAGQMTDHLTNNGSNIVSDVTATLRAGWNPIVLDYNQSGGGARADLRLTGAPSGIATNVTIPVDRLRPVAVTGSRVTSFDDIANAAIPNNPGTPLNRTWSPTTTGETINDLWLSYRFTHGMPAELELRLFHPDGTVKLLRTNDGNGTSPVNLRLTEFNGKSLDGASPWRLEVKDIGGGMTGTLQGWTLTAFTTGGQETIAPLATWSSATTEINAVVIDQVHVVALAPAGATSAVWVRTCDATPCTTEVWTGPYQDGDTVTAAPKRYAQLRVDLTTTTGDEATLDSVELQYRFRP